MSPIRSYPEEGRTTAGNTGRRFRQRSHEEIKVPLGTWPADKKQKDIGVYTLITTEHGFESFGMALFTKTLGMEAPEAVELIEGAKKESRGKKIHSYGLQ